MLIGLSNLTVNRRKAIIYLVVITLGMVLLGSTLGQVEFQPGLSVPGADPVVTTNLPVVQQRNSSGGSETNTALLSILALATVGFLVAVCVSVVRKANPKLIGQLALGLLFSSLLLLFLDWTVPSSPGPEISPAQAAESIPGKSFVQAPIGVPPSELNTIVMICLGVGLAILIAWLIYKSQSKADQQDRIILEADAAIQAIESGQDLKNVILRSYGQMMAYVKETRGIDRPESVTPREFERILMAKGIQKDSIQQLTRLFEKARYSTQASDKQDELDAIDCLTQIREQSQTHGRPIR